MARNKIISALLLMIVLLAVVLSLAIDAGFQTPVLRLGGDSDITGTDSDSESKHLAGQRDCLDRVSNTTEDLESSYPTGERDSQGEQKIDSSPSLFSTEWQTGASVNITYDFTDHYILPETFDYYFGYDPDDTGYLHDNGAKGFAATYADDGCELFVGVYDTDDDDTSNYYLSATYKIEAYTSGVLYYEADFYTNTTHTDYDSSFTITEDFIDANGMITGLLAFSPDMTNELCYVGFWNVTNGQYVYAEDTQQAVPANWEKKEIRIDEIRFEQDSIISHLRSEFRQTESPDLIEWRLNVPNHEYQSEIVAELPGYVNTSSIQVNPSCTTSLSSNQLTLSDTIPTIGSAYEIKATYKSQKRYLANLQETTENFLNNSNIGFEGAVDDFTATNSTTLTLNSTIVHSGAFAAKVIAAGNSEIHFDVVDSLAGDYYAGIAYYYQSAGTSTVLKWREDSSNSTYTLDQSSTNCWTQEFFFLHLEPDTTWSFSIYLTGAQTLFIDSLYFYKVKVKLSNPEFQKIKAEVTLDNLVRPNLKIPVTNTPLNLQWRDRTADSLIYWANLTTDNSGKTSHTIDTSSYSELQDQREIELRCWSWDSFWSGSQDFTEDLTEEQDLNDFDYLSWDSNTESFETSDIHYQAAAWKLEATESSDSINYLFIDPSDAPYDISNAHYFTFYVKSNVTKANGHIYHFENSTNYQKFFNILDLVADEWIKIILDIQNPQSGQQGSPTLSQMEYVRLDPQFPNPTQVEILLDKIQVIQVQSYYFTPQYPEDFVYYYEESPEDNEWDFTEGTNESLEKFYGTTHTETLTDGYYQISVTGSTTPALSLYLSGSSWTIDTSVYTKCSMRIYSTHETRFRLLDSDNNAISDYTDLTTSFAIYTITLSDNDDWTGNDQIRLQLWEKAAGSNFDSNENFYIDYIRLVHRDSPSLTTESSYAFTTSTNNSLTYRCEIDSAVQTNSLSDLQEFSIDKSSGTHTINCTPWLDTTRKLVFIPGTSLTTTYNVFHLDYEGTPANNSNVERNTAIQTIDWTVEEISTWIIYRNSTEVASGTGVVATYAWDVSESTLAVWNFTCFARGSGTNENTSSVYFTLRDSVTPTLTFSGTTNDSNVEAGDSVTVSWTISENVTYTLYRNGTTVETGSGGSLLTSWSFSWTWATASYTTARYYNFTLEVTDSGSNTNSSLAWWYLRDTTAPAISTKETEVSIEFATSGTSPIDWTVTELWPDTYTITQGGATVASGSYSNGEKISYNVPRNVLTTYTYEFTANDTAGNSDFLRITVTITEPSGGEGLPGAETSAEKKPLFEIGDERPLALLLLIVLVVSLVLGSIIYDKKFKKGGKKT